MYRVTLAAAAALVLLPSLVEAQDTPINGEAVLKHPLGVLATRSVDLVAAGKIDEVMALRTKDDRDEWETAPAADRKDFGERMRQNAPSPTVFADLVRASGALAVDGDQATLEATGPAGTLRQAFTREEGQWRIAFGPMLMGGIPGADAPVTRIEGAEVAGHPAMAVVLRYAELVHAGKIDEALAGVGSAQAQARWKALPASEKKESTAFRKRMLPPRAELVKAIASSAVLLLEGHSATLNLVTVEPATATTMRGSSTTVVIPLALEQGQWKIAQ